MTKFSFLLASLIALSAIPAHANGTTFGISKVEISHCPDVNLKDGQGKTTTTYIAMGQVLVTPAGTWPQLAPAGLALHVDPASIVIDPATNQVNITMPHSSEMISLGIGKLVSEDTGEMAPRGCKTVEVDSTQFKMTIATEQSTKLVCWSSGTVMPYPIGPCTVTNLNFDLSSTSGGNWQCQEAFKMKDGQLTSDTCSK